MELHPLFLLHRLSLPAHFRRFVAIFHQFTISNNKSWVSIVEFCLIFLAYISREILDLAIIGLKSYFLSVENGLSLSLYTNLNRLKYWREASLRFLGFVNLTRFDEIQVANKLVTLSAWVKWLKIPFLARRFGLRKALFDNNEENLGNEITLDFCCDRISFRFYFILEFPSSREFRLLHFYCVKLSLFWRNTFHLKSVLYSTEFVGEFWVFCRFSQSIYKRL